MTTEPSPDHCADCGTNLVDVRPRLTIGEVPICAECLGTRLPDSRWFHLLKAVRQICEQADAHRKPPPPPRPRVPGSCARWDCDEPADPTMTTSAKLCAAHRLLLEVSLQAITEEENP